MSKVSAMVAEARSRRVSSDNSRWGFACRGLEIEERVDTFPFTTDGETVSYITGLQHRRLEITTNDDHLVVFSFQRFFHPDFVFGARCIQVRSIGHDWKFYADGTGILFSTGEELYDILIAEIHRPRRRIPVRLEVSRHFEPLPLQWIKTFPKGWAASKWTAGKAEPIHRSTLREQAEIERNLRRIEAREWD